MLGTAIALSALRCFRPPAHLPWSAVPKVLAAVVLAGTLFSCSSNGPRRSLSTSPPVTTPYGAGFSSAHNACGAMAAIARGLTDRTLSLQDTPGRLNAVIASAGDAASRNPIYDDLRFDAQQARATALHRDILAFDETLTAFEQDCAPLLVLSNGGALSQTPHLITRTLSDLEPTG
jgi:hypothetical protein